MKSYKQHLESVMTLESQNNLNRNPVHRSSGIFPVIQNESYTTFITFLGYWLLKRKIKEVGLLCTLRNQSGNILIRKTNVIDRVQSFVVRLSDLLLELKGLQVENFIGSLELEIFSAYDVVFPYPAFVVCYYNQHFSTAVHTTGRVYNDIRDLQENTEVSVAEAGFDIYADNQTEPFIAFVNGAIPQVDQQIEFSVINSPGNVFNITRNLPQIQPYETVFLKIKQWVDLENMLMGKVGTVKIKHQFSGFFPRFIAGNFQKQSLSALSITHTYYDCSNCESDSDYWTRQSDQYQDSSVLVPIFLGKEHYTEIVIYPIFSPSIFKMSIDFYTEDGICLKQLPDFLELDSYQTCFKRVEIDKIIEKYGINSTHLKSANLIFNWKDSNRIPTRLKLGFNSGRIGRELNLPCNICFAPNLGQPSFQEKPRTFRWFPLINVGNSLAVLTNSSPAKEYLRYANVEVQIFRESDQTFLAREVTIPPRGSFILSLKDDDELCSFLNHEIGWVALKSDNPNLCTWYFDFHDSGVVLGDHGF